MGFVPLFIDVADQPCVVIGGNAAAARRIDVLRRAQARVTVIGPQVVAEIARWAADGVIGWIAREFVAADLQGARLAYCYDGAAQIAEIAAQEARMRGIPLNVADRPALCTFIAPAIVERGPLQIAISTSGASPTLARLIREELEGAFGPEYAQLAQLAGAARTRLRERIAESSQRMEIAKTATAELYAAFKRNDPAAMAQVLERCFGLSMAELGFADGAFNQSSRGSRSE